MKRSRCGCDAEEDEDSSDEVQKFLKELEKYQEEEEEESSSNEETEEQEDDGEDEDEEESQEVIKEREAKRAEAERRRSVSTECTQRAAEALRNKRLAMVRWRRPEGEESAVIQDMPDLALLNIMRFLPLAALGRLAQVRNAASSTHSHHTMPQHRYQRKQTCKFMSLFIKTSNALWYDVAHTRYGDLPSSACIHDISLVPLSLSLLVSLSGDAVVVLWCRDSHGKDGGLAEHCEEPRGAGAPRRRRRAGAAHKPAAKQPPVPAVPAVPHSLCVQRGARVCSMEGAVHLVRLGASLSLPDLSSTPNATFFCCCCDLVVHCCCCHEAVCSRSCAARTYMCCGSAACASLAL